MIRRERLTHRGHNLRLQAKLVAEATCKIADSTLPITRNVGDLPDMIEHVTACKQKDSNQA